MQFQIIVHYVGGRTDLLHRATLTEALAVYEDVVQTANVTYAVLKQGTLVWAQFGDKNV